jgi:hypothetical protein
LLEPGGGPLFGVVAETVAAGKLAIRIDRFGRPEIKNVIMGTKTSTRSTVTWRFVIYTTSRMLFTWARTTGAPTAQG